MQTKLTVQLVKQLVEVDPPARNTFYWDLTLKRFALRVWPARKAGEAWGAGYVVKYVAPDGTVRWMKIGDPSSMSLDAARAAAKAVLAQVDSGNDPAAAKAEARAAWTVAQAVDVYVASREFAKHSTRHQENVASSLRHHVVHHIGKTKLAALDVPAVKRLVATCETDQRVGRRQRRTGGVGAARKMVRHVSALLTWAVGQGVIPSNCIIGSVRLDGDAGREAVITTAEEYQRLFTAMDALVAEGKLSRTHQSFFITAAATGMRRGELRELRWSAVDLAERRITLALSKGAKLAKSGPRIERVSLPPIAAAALAAIRPDDAPADALVFPPSRNAESGAMLSVTREWHRVRDAAGLPADLVLHSLRHSIGTLGVLAGLQAHEVQKLLRHRNISMTQRYVHLADTSRLTDRATAGVLGGADEAEVVPLRRTAIKSA